MLQIDRTMLLVDESVCRANIRRMATKAHQSGARFRPHFKTHQSLKIGEWFREAGVESITVSSVVMAEYFSGSWHDITIAIPFNILEIPHVNRIDPACAINVCVLSEKTLTHLQADLQREVGVWVKIDVGYHRTGLQPDDNEVEKIVRWFKAHGQSSKMKLRGFLAHAGHSYSAGSAAAIRTIDKSARDTLEAVRDRYLDSFESLEISLGDTPSCSVVENFRGVDELRPGNLVFYDLMQYTFGVCRLQDIAVAMACPVIARHSDKLVVHGGSAHFSKDSFTDSDGNDCFGWVVDQKSADIADGWNAANTGLRLTSLSQEHGIITGPRKQRERYDIGDYVLVLPVHSCLTGCSMKAYRTLSGEHLDHL